VTAKYLVVVHRIGYFVVFVLALLGDLVCVLPLLPSAMVLSRFVGPRLPIRS
jgi:hypothetical protein